jgi:hypothetical protein
MAILVVANSFSENRPMRAGISSAEISLSGAAIKFTIIAKISNSIKNNIKME